MNWRAGVSWIFPPRRWPEWRYPKQVSRRPLRQASPCVSAFVGVGNRGSYHLNCALGIEGVEVAAVCDVDDKALYRAKRWV